MIKQHTAILLTLCLIITQPTHAYTLTWLPHQPAKHSATVGSSQSHSDSTQTSTRTSGSTVKAGGNLNLTATAAKGEGGNITIQGSDIKAGRDISLDASNTINLLAAQDTSSQVSHNSSSSSGAGVSISKAGPGITANASKANGNSDGHDVTNIATTLNAGNKLTLKSGKDTNLIGATANGKQVVADVGGDLNIASVQDTSTYTSKQESISASGTIGLAGGSANLNASQQKINGNYASVKTQSGLKAGDGGFQVTVKGNTDLKGGVIASTDKAVGQNNNTFTTVTLTQSDLTNVATYDAQSLSVGVGTNGVTPPMALNAKDKDSSVTRSGISGANVSITNTEKQKQLTGKDSAETIATLNRDVATDKDTSGAINNNLNVQEIQTGFAVTQTFVQQTNTFVANQAQKSERLKAAGEQKQKEANQETDPAHKQQLQAEAQSLNQQAADSKDESAQWQPGGSYRQIATALTAAAGGNVTGGTNQLIQGAAVNYIQSLGATEVKKIADSLGSESARAALHGILACGGASAQGANCDTAALGASTGVVINTLLGGDPSTMSAAELENRKNLVATLVTGIAAAAGSTEVSSATNAAVMETENNALFLHKGFVVARDNKDDDKVVKLNDKDAKKLQVIGDGEMGELIIPIVADNTVDKLSGSTVYDLNNPQDFNALKEGTDMGYYSAPEGESNTRIYFQNGMDNKLEDAQKTASLIANIIGAPVGVIANDTHGIAGDTAEYLKQPQTKDVLNEYTYRKLDESGMPTLIVMHSAGNNDALRALQVGSLYDHQYPNLSFYSLGSPIGNNTLNQIVGNAGGSYLGQTNDWRDPVTYSKTAAGGVLGATGVGVYYGAVYGGTAGSVGGPLGMFFGGAVGGAVGAVVTGGSGLYGLSTYHPMTNYLGKPQVVQTLQQWQNKPIP